jgi:hypothetical protein
MPRHAATARALPCRRAALAQAAVACALAATALVALPALATTYKWTDANGHVVYSDQPPPGNVKAEMIGPAPPPSNPNAVKDMAQKDLELKQRQKDRTDAAVKVEKAKEVDTRRHDLCLSVRGRLKEMREGKPVFRYDANGTRVILNDTERAIEMNKELAAEKTYCGGPST